MDMSAAYRGAVSTNLPKAKIVFDRFHVMKLFNEKLSDLRRVPTRSRTCGKSRGGGRSSAPSRNTGRRAAGRFEPVPRGVRASGRAEASPGPAPRRILARVGIDQQAASVVQVVGGASPARRNHGYSRDHRLQHGVAAALAQAGQHEHVGLAHPVGHLGPREPSRERDHVVEAQLAGPGREFQPLRTIADEFQRGGRLLVADLAEGLQEEVDALQGDQPSHEKKLDPAVGPRRFGGRRCPRRVPGGRVDAVLDHLDDRPPHPSRQAVPRSGVGGQQGRRPTLARDDQVGNLGTTAEGRPGLGAEIDPPLPAVMLGLVFRGV